MKNYTVLVTFAWYLDKSYLKNFGKGVSFRFHDIGISLRDIIEDTIGK